MFMNLKLFIRKMVYVSMLQYIDIVHLIYQYLQAYLLEIDPYIGLPIFLPIFKHFTIIGYQFCKKNKNIYLSHT